MKYVTGKTAMTVAAVVSLFVSACGRDVTAPAPMVQGGTAQTSVVVSGSTVTVTWPAATNCGAAPKYKVVLESGTTVISFGDGNDDYRGLTHTFTGVPDGSYSVTVSRKRNEPNNDGCGNNGWFQHYTTTATIGTPPAPNADNTPPVISYTMSPATPDGANGWYTSNVSIVWSVTDGESAISSSTGCGMVTVSADQGATTYTCSATSTGGTTTVTTSSVKRDATAPMVAFSGSMAYTVDQMIAVTCAASDATSGVATSICPSASGAAHSYAGPTTLNASATDNAGNSASATATFTVTATYGSLCNLVRDFVANAGIANSMCVKLDAAARAEDRGDMNAKAGSLNALALQVKAQTGKAISAANAGILMGWASTL